MVAVNVKWLYVFRAIIDAGTVTGASQLMFLTQPQLSRMLSSLEKELDMELFRRDGRRLIPTPEGLEFYRVIQPTLRALDQVPGDAEGIKTGRARPFQVAAEPFLLSALIPDVIGEMAETLSSALTIEPCMRETGLWSAKSDVACAVVALPFVQSDYDVLPFGEGELVAALPPGSPLAARDAVSIGDFAEQRFIALRSSTLMRSQIDLATAKVGITLRPWAEVSNGATALDLVARGLGATISDPVIASAYRDRGVEIRPLDVSIPMNYGFLLKPDFETAGPVDAFRALCAKVAGNIAGGFVRVFPPAAD